VTKKELIVRTPDGKNRVISLVGKRMSLGRAAINDLPYPDDVGLSRQHLAFEWNDENWSVTDLVSKNGTFVNGVRITQPTPLRPGDRISAGHLSIEFSSPGEPSAAPDPVQFVESDVVTAATTTVKNSLEGMMGPEAEDFGKTRIFQGSLQTRALIRAGQELAGHLTLSELFEVIMDLSLEAVGASRGVLMTIEGDQLVVKAMRGQGFQISSTVRDRVICEGKSELVVDAQAEKSFRDRASIVAQNIRSMLAVPLQAQERVIGLIYLDSPNLVRPFTTEDLNLLTVMANVAAIRIEHARLAEVEQQERLLAKELEQAAQIQKGLLPRSVPAVPGINLAGNTSACRTVGGDYYDFLPYADGRVAMLVGDVAGKGMPAALLMSSLQARVQVLFESSENLAANVARLNRAVASNCPDNRFITFFICVIDSVTGDVVYCNAGHNPPLVIRAGGGVEKLTAGGIMLGIIPHATYQEGRAHLEPGDVIVLYSDGVTEAAQPDDEEFGEDRLAAVVRAHLSDDPDAIISAITGAVAEFTVGAPAADDITAVIARRAR
jgi:serine phosphatase RsbU (regulator of sigma subunit)